MPVHKETVRLTVAMLLKQLVGLFLLVVVSVGPAGADQTSGAVEVEGYALIVGARKDLAREAALQNAFRRAVEQVVGVAVESKTVVRDSELLNDKIFSKSKGFIKTYRVMSEKVEEDAYRVTVLAAVSRYKLDQGLDDAGLLIKKMGKPRIAVVVMEQNVEGHAAPGGVVETYLINNLGKRGYAMVDRQIMLAAGREAAAGGQKDYSDSVVRAAAAGGAEVVIIGQATARSAAALSGTSLRPVEVSVTCRAIEVDTGELLATAVSSQQALHVNPAAAGNQGLQKAAVELAENVQRQILASWTKRLSGVRTLHMTVAGIPYTAVRRLQDALKEQIGRIEEVHDRGYRDNHLRLDLDVTGGLKDVVDELTLLGLEQASLKITGYSAGQVQARWQERPIKGGRIK
jgi:hypothetical protein